MCAEHGSRLCLGSHRYDLLPEGRLWCCGSCPQRVLAAPDSIVHLCVPPYHALPKHPLYQAGRRLPTLWNSGFRHLLLLPHRYALPPPSSLVSPELSQLSEQQ